MKLSRGNEPWLNFVLAGKLKEAYDCFKKNNISYRLFNWLKLRKIVSILGFYFIKWSKRKYRLSSDEVEVNLSSEIVLFWKDADVTGRYLLTKILKSVILNKTFPIRAGAWFAHWLVFQGEYKYSEELFNDFQMELSQRNENEKMYGELLSLIANYYFVRGNFEQARKTHKQSLILCKKYNYTFFSIFNLGTWGRIPAMTGDLNEMNEILSIYDDLNPNEPDERYGLRTLIYCAFLNYKENNIELGDLFFRSAKSCFDKSGSPLDKALFLIFESLISVSNNNLITAHELHRKSKEELAKFGKYAFYNNLLDLIGFYLNGNGTSLSKLVEKNRYKHSKLNMLLETATMNTIGSINGINDENKWYKEFFESSLSTFEVIESISLNHLKTLVQKISRSEDVVFKKLSDNSEPYFNIIDSGKISLLQFDLYCYEQRYEVVVSSVLKNWRNAEIYQAVQTSLKTLQSISLNFKLKSELSDNTKAIEVAKIALSTAHDLRSPLLTLKNIYDEIPITESRVKDAAKGCMDRIEKIANDLLEQNRKYKISDSDPAMRLVSIEDLLNQIVLEKNFESVDQKSIAIETDYEISRSLVQVSPVLFKNIISNIINNSLEAIEQKGNILIRSRADTNKVIIEIIDNGKGIPASNLENVFNEGFSFGKDNGNGIGLYEAKKRIEEWKGNININSTENSGTTLTISIPRFQKVIVKKGKTSSAKKTVYLVDDDEIIINSFINKIEKNNPQVEIKTYCRPEDFLSEADNIKEDSLILTDLNFENSEFTGVDILSRFKLLDNIDGILMSGYPEEHIAKEFDLTGISKVVLKGNNSFYNDLEKFLN